MLKNVVVFMLDVSFILLSFLDDQLLVSRETLGDVDDLYGQLLRRVINRSLEAEMDAHLEDGRAAGVANRRNGRLGKFVKGTFGELEIETPRDRQGSFEPRLVKKRQIRLGAWKRRYWHYSDFHH
jgi:transposase-like protein